MGAHIRHVFLIQWLFSNLTHRPEIDRSLGLRVGELKSAKDDLAERLEVSVRLSGFADLLTHLLDVLRRADLADVTHVLTKDGGLVDGAARGSARSVVLPSDS